MAVDTKQILNIGLLIGAFLVGKKLLETFGILKTKEEQQQQEEAKTLDENASADQTTVDKNKNLALTPNGFATIFKYVLSQNPKYKTYNKEQQTATARIYFDKYIGEPNIYLKYAQDIGKAKNVWYLPDTEEKAYAVFRLLKSQQQISYMVYRFYELYKIDLLTYLKTFMNTEQLAEVQSIIKNKPLFALR